MPRARSNGIEIEYETIGEGEPLLLIMGLGAQLVLWPNEFCERLADRGFRVIRFDNRDVGLSTKLHDMEKPRVKRLIVRALLGLPIEAPYTLLDMADDTTGLLDALELRDAHVVGVSMGGMIAQTMSIVHQSRVRSMTSIMSGPGNRLTVLGGKPSAMLTLLKRPPKTREEAVEREIEFFTTCGGSGYEPDLDLLREQAERAWDRGPNPPGFARHIAAILSTGDRTAALRFVRAPTLVIHGDEDALIRPVAGRATARAIPGASLRMMPGMGHALPRGLWPRIIDEIATHAHGASQRARAAA